MLWKNRILAALGAAAVGALLAAAIWYLPAGHAAGGDITYDTIGVRGDQSVLTLDGNSAPAQLLTYWIGTYASYINDYLGMDVTQNWDTEPEPGVTLSQMVKDEAMTLLRQQLVLENLCRDYDITLSAESEQSVAQARQYFIDQSGGEAAYAEELYKLGLTPEGYDRLTRTDYLYAALRDAYAAPGSPLAPSDGDLLSYAGENGYITADHILISTRNPETQEPLDQAAAAEKKALAEQLLRQLRDSADPVSLFQKLADEYSEDPGRQTNPHGYTFTRGTMVESFDAAARALGENEYSDLVESDYGYHIILRRPLDADAAVEAVRDEWFDNWFFNQLEDAQITEDPALERFDVPALYNALRAAQTAGAPGDGEIADSTLNP